MSKEKEQWIGKAQDVLKKGLVLEAIKFYERALEHDKKDVRIILKLAELYEDREKEKAISKYLEASKYLKKDGFWSRATAVAKQVLRLDPQNIQGHQELIELFGKLEEYTEQEKYRLKLESLLSMKEEKSTEEQELLIQTERAIALEAVEVAMGKSQNGDQAANEFLEEMNALMKGDMFYKKPKRKKSKN